VFWPSLDIAFVAIGFNVFGDRQRVALKTARRALTSSPRP
jgi:hypothetical protein